MFPGTSVWKICMYRKYRSGKYGRDSAVLVTIDEDSREPQVWRVFNDRPMQFYFKIIKKDAQTDLPILKNSAHYKIYECGEKEICHDRKYGIQNRKPLRCLKQMRKAIF